MSFDKVYIRFLFILLSIGLCRGLEYCLNDFRLCPNYCCEDRICCSKCSRSVRDHSECYSYPIPAIAGGIMSSITVIIVVSITISICCGCICSERTGIHRRGRVFHDGSTTVTVISQAPNGFPPDPNAYQNTFQTYQQGQNVYHIQGQYMYPPMPPGVSYGQVPPPYPVHQNYGNPPAYSSDFVNYAK